MQVPFVQSSKKPTADKPGSRGNRTTVLHLCPDLEPGDPAREAVDLAVFTQRAGWRALMASRGGLLVPETERAAVRHTRMPLASANPFASMLSRLRLNTLIEKERPVLIHAHGYPAVTHAAGIARKRGLPFVADLTRPLPDRPRTRRMFDHMLKMNCAVRVPSEFMAKNLSDTFRWPSLRIRVIPPGIDTQWCHAGGIGAERLQALSRLWRLPEQAAVILVPMPYVPGGGHQQLLEALAHMKREDVFAVLVGDNRANVKERADIEEYVGHLGLDGKVIMPDYCLDWPAACWLSSVIVVPNLEPLGQNLELLVAQAIGRPVIVTNCGGNRELVEGNEPSWIVPPGDSAALAAGLSRALDLRIDERVRLADRAHNFVAETFPQATWFNSVMELYDFLLIPAAQKVEAEAA